MPPVLNANAIVTCPHGGTFKLIPKAAVTHSVGGGPPITLTDVPGAVPVTPCPVLSSGAGAANGCATLVTAVSGLSPTITVGGSPVLNQTAKFTCAPSGMQAFVTSPGQTTIQA